MKINRVKRAHKHLQFYTNFFEFREPFQVLFDGTFCFQALKNHFQITVQLPKYFQGEIKPITTACIIIESEKLAVSGTATQLLKSFKVHRCGHEKRPISGAECIKEITKTSHYTSSPRRIETYRIGYGRGRRFHYCICIRWRRL